MSTEDPGMLDEPRLLDSERLALVRQLAFVDDDSDGTELIYDKLTKLATRIIKAPVSLMSLVAADFQFFKSSVGLPEPWNSARKTPLSHSCCKHIVSTDQPLIVSDARQIDYLKHNKAIPDLNVIAYLGVPIHVHLAAGRRTLGSFCVIDSDVREWNATEIAIVKEMGEIVNKELDLAAKAKRNKQYSESLDALHAGINRLLNEADEGLSQEDYLQALRTL